MARRPLSVLVAALAIFFILQVATSMPVTSSFQTIGTTPSQSTTQSPTELAIELAIANGADLKTIIHTMNQHHNITSFLPRAFFAACAAGRIDVASAIIGYNEMNRDSLFDGLSVAVLLGRRNIAHWLLQYVKVNPNNLDLFPPLFLAIQTGNQAMIQLLFGYNAVLSYEMLDYVDLFHTELLDFLFDQQTPENILEWQRPIMTDLMHACMSASFHRFLWDANSKDNDASAYNVPKEAETTEKEPYSGWFDVENSHLKIDPDTTDELNCFKVAVAWNRTDLVRSMLKHGNMQITDHERVSPLLLAIRLGFENIVELFIDAGAEPTELELMAAKQFLPHFSLLPKMVDNNVELIKEKLLRAAKFDDAQTMELLLKPFKVSDHVSTARKHGIKSRTNFYDQNRNLLNDVLNEAIEFNSEDTARVLLKLGARPSGNVMAGVIRSEYKTLLRMLVEEFDVTVTRDMVRLAIGVDHAMARFLHRYQVPENIKDLDDDRRSRLVQDDNEEENENALGAIGSSGSLSTLLNMHRKQGDDESDTHSVVGDSDNI